jgi:hypothetical protein
MGVCAKRDNTKALPALHNTMGALTNRPLPIRLDDGTTGTVRVESRPCTAADDCEPFDCGCPLPYESYWIDVDDSVGRTVAHLHLWAVYGVVATLKRGQVLHFQGGKYRLR